MLSAQPKQDLDRPELFKGPDHELGQLIGHHLQDLEGISASTEGESLVSVTVSDEVSDHIAQVDISGESLMGLSSGRIVVATNRRDQVRSKLPAFEQPAAQLGVLHAKKELFRLQNGLLVLFDLADELGIFVLQRFGQDNLADVMQEAGCKGKVLVIVIFSGH